RAKGLSVEAQLGVEAAWSPTLQDLAHGGVIHSQRGRIGREIRRERDDAADVEILIRPTVEASTDAVDTRRVVDGRVAQGALNADRLETAVAMEFASDADDRVQLEQRERDGRVVQVDPVGRDVLEHVVWHLVHVDLKPEGERGFRAEPATHTAEA